MTEMSIGVLSENPHLLKEVESTLQRVGCRVISPPFELLTECLVEIRIRELALRFPSHKTIFEINEPDEVGSVFEVLFEDTDATSEFWWQECSPEEAEPPWPRFLMPNTIPAMGDGPTYLGRKYPIPYIRFRLDRLHGTSVLSRYSLYEPYYPGSMDSPFIDLFRQGALLAEVEHLRNQDGVFSTPELLQRLVERELVAARVVPGHDDALCRDAIAKLFDCRDDLLALAVVLAVGFGLARAYKPHWWFLLDRLELSRVCATTGLKQDWCGTREERAWYGLCQELTRTDRWTHGLREVRWRSDWSPPPSAAELLGNAVRIARDTFPELFTALTHKLHIPLQCQSGRPMLTARKIPLGWFLFWDIPGANPRHARIKEGTTRKSRILNDRARIGS